MTDRQGFVSGPISDEPLRIWERWAVAGLLVVILGFGVLVEVRSAFLSKRRTDASCYFRAGWAVRSGANIYEVTDDNYWHYAYPPGFAVLMVPLADAPAGESRQGMLPYSVTVGIWYVLEVLATLLAVHWFAAAIEESSANPAPRGSRRWWYARLIPIYVCLAPIGCTYSRGQVNMFLVALIAGIFRATVRGRRFASGLWLAAAICLKIFPAFLLIFPVWRRDGRALLGVAAGLLIGIGLIPALVWGTQGAIDVHAKLVEAVIKPGLGIGGEATRDKELMEMTATDNQSIQAVVHNYRNWSATIRPPHADASTKAIHLIAGLLLTGGLVLAYGRRSFDDATRNLLFLGGLVLVMTVTSPVSHTHYFCLALPAVMGLAARSMGEFPKRPAPPWPTLIFLYAVGICFALPMIPYWQHRREFGLSLFGCLALWIAVVTQLRVERRRAVSPRVAEPLPLARAA
jgi:hypothetical protein